MGSFRYLVIAILLLAGNAQAATVVSQTTFGAYTTAQLSRLAAKQATLISATNIKTINSTSLLGSGDITISGGGTPASSVVAETTYGASSVVGTSANYARQDHTHGTPATVKDTTAITGLLKGNGSAISAASAGTDYLTPSGSAASLTSFPTLNQTTTGTAAGLTAAYIDWNSGTGGSSISNKPTIPAGASTVTGETTYGAASNAGSAATYSKGDHTHGTPATTKDTTALTGILKGNGSAISAATVATDYSLINGTGFVKSAGTTLSYDASTYLTTAGTAASSTAVTTTADNTATTYYPIFGTAAGTTKSLYVDSVTTPLSYVPSTSTLTATTFVGALTGTASGNATWPGAGVPVSTGSAWGSSLNITAISDSTSTTSSTTAGSATAVKAAYDLANGKEASLGNPGTNGYVLSSTTTGTRSWVASGGGLPDQTGNNGKYLTTNGSAASWGTLAGGGDMVSTNNLSDVANAATARTNLGVQPTADPSFTGTTTDENLTVSGVRIATPGTAACTHSTVAIPITSAMIELSTDGDSDLDICSLAAGTAGQVIDLVVKTVGNAADSLKITPSAAFVGGIASFNFGVNPLGKTLSLMYTSAGWMIMGSNASPVLLANQSVTTPAAGFASDTYLAGSFITLPFPPTVGTTYKLTFDVSKTTAGTAAPTITVRTGTGVVGDTSRCALAFAAGTAAADAGIFEVFATFRTVGTGTTAVLACTARLTSNLTTTGLSNAVKYKGAISSGFDSTAGVGIGVSYNGGASAAHTITLVRAELLAR